MRRLQLMSFVYVRLSLSLCVEYVLEVCGSTRTRGYGSGTGRCLTGRVGYGYEVHGSGIPVFTRKKHNFSRCWSYIEFYFHFFLFSERERVVIRPSVCLSVVCNVRAPYSGNEIFRNVSAPFNTIAIR